jgi:hypothetical protein
MQIIIRLKFKNVNKKMKTRILTILYEFVLWNFFLFLKGKNYNVVTKLDMLGQTVSIWWSSWMNRKVKRSIKNK